MSADLLAFRGFGVAFGGRVVLADITAGIGRTGLTTLVGPAGSGKSTLVRTVAGLNDAHPALSTWGTATLDGQPLDATRPPIAGEVRRGVGLVAQHARFFVSSVRENLVSALPERGALEPATQTRMVGALLASRGLEELAARLGDDAASLSKPLQRRLAIVRAIASDPLVLMADEPTADLDEADAVDVLALLRSEARHRCVLFVTHHQRFARVVGGRVILLAGGRVQEDAEAEAFWSAPCTPAARAFVATGGCPEPSPDAVAEDLDGPAPPPLPDEAARRHHHAGPRGFFWLRPGQIGGVPRPGIVESLEADLDGLARLGITTLVTLEESTTVAAAPLAERGIESVHFPVVDMGVPGFDAARGLAERIAAMVGDGRVVALHCRAGLGRTGTLLAAQLIFDGESASVAIERVRRLNPRCIQSQAQVEFLSAFEDHMRGRGATAATSTPFEARSVTEKESQYVA